MSASPPDPVADLPVLALGELWQGLLQGGARVVRLTGEELETAKCLLGASMRFFTPQLYLRFNSPDDEEAARAHEAWEKAIEDYRNRLNEFRDGLPSPVRKLAEISLHDAEVVARFEDAQSAAPFFDFPFPFPFPLWTAVEIMLLKRDSQMLLLIYCLWDRVRVQSAPEAWRFSKLREHWLYDEIECIQDRRPLYLHRVLFSTGNSLEIPFITAVVHEFPPRETGTAAAPERSA